MLMVLLIILLCKQLKHKTNPVLCLAAVITF